MKNQGGRVDHTGKKIASLTFVRYSHSDKFGKAIWLTKCDCGNTKSIGVAEILKGTTKSCGCVNTKTRSALGKKRWALVKDLPRVTQGYIPSVNMTVDEQQVVFDIDSMLELGPVKPKMTFPKYNFSCPKCGEARRDFLTRYRRKFYYCVPCGCEFIVNDMGDIDVVK